MTRTTNSDWPAARSSTVKNRYLDGRSELDGHRKPDGHRAQQHDSVAARDEHCAQLSYARLSYMQSSRWCANTNNAGPSG